MIITRKTLLAASGLFLCLFLIVHLSANLLLLLPPELAQEKYNQYSQSLREHPLIGIVSYVLYASIIMHTYFALMITLKNRQTRNSRYQMNRVSENSTWSSRNMGLLGFIILIFIVVHMANFWARAKLGLGGEIPLDPWGHADLYLLVVELFKNPFYLVFYTLLMIPLGLHLSHGVKSACISMGFYHHRYLRYASKLAIIYALVVSIGFILIPLVIVIAPYGRSV